MSDRHGKLILHQRERKSNQRHEDRGSIPKDNLDRGISPKQNVDNESILKESSIKGRNPKERYPFPLVSKGEI